MKGSLDHELVIGKRGNLDRRDDVSSDAGPRGPLTGLATRRA